MYWDAVGTFCSLIATYFYIQLDRRAWLMTIIATTINGALYWYKGFFANTFLEGFYFMNAFIGWLFWSQNKDKNQKSLGNYDIKNYLSLTLVFLIFFYVIHNILVAYTSSKIPFLDAFTTSLSIIAQWLMCRKIITTWVLWFIVDAIYALMYFQSQLPFHGGLMFIYMCLAILGFVRWYNVAYPRISVDNAELMH